MLLLDVYRAFDRIEYVRLFKLLRERNMCPIVLRLIIAMYYLTNDASKMGRNFIKTIPSWKLGLTRGCMISSVIYSIS